MLVVSGSGQFVEETVVLVASVWLRWYRDSMVRVVRMVVPSSGMSHRVWSVSLVVSVELVLPVVVVIVIAARLTRVVWSHRPVLSMVVVMVE